MQALLDRDRLLIAEHLARHPADAGYVKLLLRHDEHQPGDATYGAWLKYNLMGIERGRDFIARLEGHVGQLSGLRVLDVGSGGGGFAIALERHGCSVSAVEIDPVRLEWLHTRVRDHGLCARIYDRPVEELGLEPGSVDVITCRGVLEHVDDWRALVQNLVALNPRAIYFTFPNKLSLFKIWRDPHYGLFLAVFLEGRLRWLQAPYLRLRGVTREAWVVQIPLRWTVWRFLEKEAPGYRQVPFYPLSFDKVENPESIRFRPARLAARACAAVGVSAEGIKRLLAAQRPVLDFLLVRH